MFFRKNEKFIKSNFAHSIIGFKIYESHYICIFMKLRLIVN